MGIGTVKLEVVKTIAGYVAISDEEFGDGYYYDTKQKSIRNSSNNHVPGSYKKKIEATDMSMSIKLPGVPQFELKKVEPLSYSAEQINPVIKFLKRIADGAEVNNYAWREANELLLTLKQPEEHLLAIEVRVEKSIHYDSYHDSYKKDYEKYIKTGSYIMPATQEEFESWGKIKFVLNKPYRYPDGLLEVVNYIY